MSRHLALESSCTFTPIQTIENATLEEGDSNTCVFSRERDLFAYFFFFFFFLGGGGGVALFTFHLLVQIYLFSSLS